MTTTTLILLVIYLVFILGILGFLVIFFVSIKPYKNFSPLIMPAFKGFMILFAILAIFGAYKIWTGENVDFGENPFDISVRERSDF